MSDAARSLVRIGPNPRRGEWLSVQCTLAHPMESGHRRGASGQMLPRDIVNELLVRFNGELVAQFTLHAAVAANPYVAFGFVPQASGTLQLTWRGDNGFAHTSERRVDVL